MQRKLFSFVTLAAVLLAVSLRLGAVTAFYSDCQSMHTVHSQIVSRLVEFQPSAVFIGGDVTMNARRQDEYDKFFEVTKPLAEKAQIYPAMGNHDIDKELFLKNFPQVDSLTYYSVERESIIWIVLNSNLKLAPGSAQYNWLVQNLEANIDKTVVIVMHHPIYSSGPHGDEKGFNLLFPALFKRYSVAAVFSGHDHLYERSVRDEIAYVVFGGGGYKLYDSVSLNNYAVVTKKTHGFLIFEAENDVMNVTAYDLEGEVIDSFSFAIKGAAATDKEAQSE
ncbi:MAG: metallophosphoesterase [Candidatus Cloacimonadaceae bacterium]